MSYHVEGVYDLSRYVRVNEPDLTVIDDPTTGQPVVWGKVEYDHYPDYNSLSEQLFKQAALLPRSLIKVFDRCDPARGRMRLLIREPDRLPTPDYIEMLRGLARAVRAGWGGVAILWCALGLPSMIQALGSGLGIA